MTEPDTLERIVEELTKEAEQAEQDEDISLRSFGKPFRDLAARIGALIPSKAEREFLEAAMAWGDWYNRQFPTEDNWSQEESDMIRAYRALLAERGK